MRTLIAALCLAALAGCGTSVQSADQDHVSIRFHNFEDSPVTLQPMAEEHCADYDREAVYQNTTSGEGVLGFLTGLPLEAQYECRPPYRAS